MEPRAAALGRLVCLDLITSSKSIASTRRHRLGLTATPMHPRPLEESDLRRVGDSEEEAQARLEEACGVVFSVHVQHLLLKIQALLHIFVVV